MIQEYFPIAGIICFVLMVQACANIGSDKNWKAPTFPENSTAPSTTLTPPSSSLVGGLTMEEHLNRYTQAMLEADGSVLLEYAYPDIEKYFQPLTNYDFELRDMVYEEMVPELRRVKEAYKEYGIRHFFKLEKNLGSIRVRGEDIYGFVLTDRVGRETASLVDTLRLLGFARGDQASFLGANDITEAALSYRFTPTEIRRIMEFAYEERYQAFLDDFNQGILESHEWRLEAWGPNNQDLFTFNGRSKDMLLEKGLGYAPQRILKQRTSEFSLMLINGQNLKIPLKMEGGHMTTTPVYGAMKWRATIKPNGIEVYYLDLTPRNYDEPMVLVYKGYPLE